MKKIGVCFTIVVFGLVMCFPWLSLFRPSQSMEGAFVEAERPDLTKDGVWNGSWQNDTGNYFSDHMPGREYMIKAKNQFVYEAFHNAPAPRVVIGKDNVLFSRSVLNLWYQLTGPTTDAFMQELAVTIEEFTDLMEAQGMKTAIYITPSKARYYNEYAPVLFSEVAEPRDPELSAYEKLKKVLEPMDIPVFDSIEWLDSRRQGTTLDGLPLFNTTGMHWTSTVGTKVGAALGEFLEQELGYPLADLTVTSEPVEEPEYPDADLAGIMNMYTSLTDEYTRPIVTVTNLPDNLEDAPSILCRGGSFMGQSLARLIQNGCFEKDIYMENTQFFTDRFASVTQFTEYDQVDLKSAFEGIDIVLLEVNEASIDVMGFEFMEYVLEHQDEIFAAGGKE